MSKQTRTVRYLFFLIFTFVIAFAVQNYLHIFFLDLRDKLDSKTSNLQAKNRIGEFIIEDLLKLKTDFFTLATTTSDKSRTIIFEDIKRQIKDVHEALDVLEKGGILTRVIKLNVANQHSLYKNLAYEPSKKELSLEAIDIRPKLNQLQDMSYRVVEMIKVKNQYAKAKDTTKLLRHIKKVQRFFKRSPAFFLRMTENARRIIYENEQELNVLIKQIEKDKEYYSKLEVMLITTTLLLVLIFGYIVAKNMNKNNKRLATLNIELNEKMAQIQQKEASVRGILDAQKNIVVVSNGIEIIDYNEALLNFFPQYKSFDEFREKHKCICELFEDVGDGYVVNKKYRAKNWLEYIVSTPEVDHKVAMKKNNSLHHFAINAQRKNLGKDVFIVVVSFNDITKEIYSREKLKELNDNLENMVEEKTKELQELNENLEQKILLEVDKNRQKDQQMISQSRFAALGEMIGNIAHQWRQPLSAISTTASGIQLQMQLGISTNEEIDKGLGEIMGFVRFLTQTIEDFRSFFKEDKEKVDFDLSEVLTKSINITSASYKDNEIFLEESTKEGFLSVGYPSELSQVFLNILNNAKDAILENDVKDRLVHVSTASEGNDNVVYIQDNAGGIPEHIIEKIFDPYFTTKHQSQGTGIGLYMSKDIVEKHMNGSISVKNRKTIIDEHEYSGACFRVAIPKKSS
jgi:signal transduction histidine kinase